MCTKKKGRDPRFIESCGDFNEFHFAKNYDFIDQYQKNELAQINQKLKVTEDEEELEKLKKAKTILRDKLISKETKKKLQAIRSDTRKQEAKMVAKGKKPYYVKKSVEKEMMKEKKFEEMSGKGNLDKWLAKKAKRKASKHRKLIPARRIRE